MEWKGLVNDFLELSDKFKVRMLMVGGGAVNFHGYQRHSADVDFWISTEKGNLQKLIKVFKSLGYSPFCWVFIFWTSLMHSKR